MTGISYDLIQTLFNILFFTKVKMLASRSIKNAMYHTNTNTNTNAKNAVLGLVDKLLINNGIKAKRPEESELGELKSHRWYAEELSAKGDFDRMGFAHETMGQARFAIKNGGMDIMKQTALSGLNLMSALKSQHVYSMSKFSKEVIYDVVTPSSDKDITYQQLYLDCIQTVFEMSQRLAGTSREVVPHNTDGRYILWRSPEFYPVIRAFAHMSAILIPNCVSVMCHDQTSTHNIIRNQLDILDIVSLNDFVDTIEAIERANRQGIFLNVCACIGPHDKACESYYEDLYDFLTYSPVNNVVLFEQATSPSLSIANTHLINIK